MSITVSPWKALGFGLMKEAKDHSELRSRNGNAAKRERSCESDRLGVTFAALC
jgi:hypothetical protein